MARPNVIMFMVDTLRPDRLGPWGPPARPTPHIGRMAEEGVFFRNFFAHMPSSHPSRASILTGRDPHTCGMRINSRPLPATEVTLTQLLRDAGYLTVATRSSRGVFPPGTRRGFMRMDLVDELKASGVPMQSVSDQLATLSDPETKTQIAEDTAAVVKWLHEYAADPGRSATPFFLWADVEDFHGAWRPPPPYDTLYASAHWDGPDVSRQPLFAPNMPETHRRRAIDLYDGLVAFLDKCVGILMDALDNLGLSDDTLLIVAGDHGTLMGEHGLWGKMTTLLDPVLRTVLIMRHKRVIPGNVRTDGLSNMNDLFATLVEHCDLPMPDGAKRYCTSLRPLWEGQDQVRDEIPLEFNLYRNCVSKGIRTTTWKYVYNRSIGEEPWGSISPAEIWRRLGWSKVMLYDLVNDPGETTNVVDRYPDVAQEMQWRLINWLIDSENDVPAPDLND